VTQVNLLPRELKQRQRARRQTGLIALAGGAVVLLLLAFWYLQGNRLNDIDQQVKAQEATNAELQSKVASLQKYAELRAQVEQQKTLLEGALVNTVHWSRILNDLSNLEPDRMWLSSMTGTAQSPAAAAVGTVPPATTGAPAAGGSCKASNAAAHAIIGNLQFQGNSLDTQTVALWLTKLEGLKGWENSWLTSAQLGDVNGTPVWQFSSSVDLNDCAAHGGGIS